MQPATPFARQKKRRGSDPDSSDGAAADQPNGHGASPSSGEDIPPSILSGLADCQRIDLPGADVLYVPRIFTREESTAFVAQLAALEQWKRPEFKIFGKVHLQGNYSCHFSDGGQLNYRYSGRDNVGQEFPEFLQAIRRRVEAVVRHIDGQRTDAKICPGDGEFQFNYCLANKYEDGNASLGMHSDDERDLFGPIASVSFGATRHFTLAHKRDKSVKRRIDLSDGSLLVMAGDTQRNYKHGVPKMKRVTDMRINLTMRCIRPRDSSRASGKKRAKR
ncbi:unnamed protein product [Vitrella brassicaformis CCMP3155]|uniref:Fe2OG dioxygenase domain-containing protein n=1 Tax=Vitrella brassicaformis (strain CCMP3155) TaxID=1169540 RepID=A0A0G4F7Y1_VITBC|nr:unnamed protein product [Vitrella brassicaformis CCMP3155]|mmetsp:Transcript_36316/g.90705  ORF Transcript_36316/g.90705 Transcript_36316/m.90705 type:complete len:276 (-) Transcript_36316:429-1256(-)|eukprot:CEM08659.1 unnamed protein product [Vitrella brassicaformis CCMP3155]